MKFSQYSMEQANDSLHNKFVPEDVLHADDWFEKLFCRDVHPGHLAGATISGSARCQETIHLKNKHKKIITLNLKKQKMIKPGHNANLKSQLIISRSEENFLVK